ncbi:MAG: 3-dehydroquinate dehydratase [Paludibacteraceae bacterium]|nr:3-dehydroquinate dehydratase [Paludibacteraceae bacterium]
MESDKHILILNGPNLNLLGRRDPKQYGTRTMEQIMVDLQRTYPEVYFTYVQSNHEGVLIDTLQQAEQYAGIVLNAGGYTHTSVALRDAVEMCLNPVIEVHLSNIHEREAFRQVSMLSDVCRETIIGKNCYEEAVSHIISIGG